MTALTAFSEVTELRARITMLEQAGHALANDAERWKQRCYKAEHERDSYATKLALVELQDDEGPTVVDESAKIRRLEAEIDHYDNSLAGAMRSALTGRRLLDAACEAIRVARKCNVWPKRYVP
jgi:chromosome segregation ATPase